MEKTFVNLVEQKKKSGFEKKSWDEWFNYKLNTESTKKTTQRKMEEVIQRYFYDHDFEQWVKNFALNLEYIWKESSAAELNPVKGSKSKNNKQSAIVIGRGPSIKKYKQLELLASSDYKGSIVCTDGNLINVLKAGITPEKFPKFYVVTIDADEAMKRFYDDKIIDKYGKKIKGIFSTLTHPSVVGRARKAQIKIHWLHTLFDYNEGRKSFNQISALMVKSKKHVNGLPAIQTGGNVGTSAWFVSWRILKCSTVTLIGINHGWEEDDPWELITSHGNVFVPLKMDKEGDSFKKLFPKIYNPEFKSYCILDPIFQYYSGALKEFIARSPPEITTINATQGGSIFGGRITCITLNDFLKKYKK
ncbi:MAG: 6-hydroxymethylpterin diphosphokinase MptE-like protein [Nitrosotalea sp.]